MSVELSDFNTAETNLNEKKANFIALKKRVLENIDEFFDQWTYYILDKEINKKVNDNLSFIKVFIERELILIDSLSVLEFIQSNLNSIVYECVEFEKDLERSIVSVNAGWSFDNFKESYKLYCMGFLDENELTIGVSIKYKDFINEFKEKRKIISQELEVKIDMLEQACLSYMSFIKNFQGSLTIHLNASIASLNKELDGFRRLRNIADNAKTENIYDNAVKKYRGLEEVYRSYFYYGIGIVVAISVLILFCKTLIVPNLFSNIEFWILKGSILVVGITLVTYFLKQSSHYQNLADQNYQTQVELQAYPTFMESIPTEEAASVRKELALKYFGREIDGAAHKDMSNLIADQMKSTTEMVKASTEAIKNLKG